MSTSLDATAKDSALPQAEPFHYPDAGSATSASLPGDIRASFAHSPRNDPETRLAEARAEGFREGELKDRERFQEELAQERARISQAIVGWEQETREYYAKIEVEVVHLALAIASKILHREAQIDRMLLAGLVRIALDKLHQNSKAIVRVHAEDAEHWRQYFAACFEPERRPEVVEDASVEPQNCLLETDMGSTELGFEKQLKEIENGLFDLMAQRPEPR